MFLIKTLRKEKITRKILSNMILLYITKYQLISIIVISLLFVLNIGYYLFRVKNKNFITILNTFLIRNLLLVVFLFYFMHWYYLELLFFILTASCFIVLMIIAVKAIRARNFTFFLRIDNLLDYLIIIYFISVYII